MAGGSLPVQHVTLSATDLGPRTDLVLLLTSYYNLLVRYFKGSSKVKKVVARVNKNKAKPSVRSMDMLLRLNRLDSEFYRLELKWT